MKYSNDNFPFWLNYPFQYPTLLQMHFKNIYQSIADMCGKNKKLLG